jgi:hypothetical protein
MEQVRHAKGIKEAVREIPCLVIMHGKVLSTVMT